MAQRWGVYTNVYIWGSYNAKWAASRDNPVTVGTTPRFVQAMQQIFFMGPVYMYMHAAGQA